MTLFRLAQRVSVSLVVTACMSSAAFAQTGPDEKEVTPGAPPATPPSPLESLKPTWHLADRLYYEPFAADPRAARIQLLFPGYSKQFPQSVRPGNRLVWQITLGRELPIVGWESEHAGLAHFSKGKSGFGIWIPISFHMIEDMQKDESNPIVDTDYRFGFMTKYERGLSDDTWLQIRFVPFAHESTHLGDEYTIHAERLSPGFERINVSYEHNEYGVSVEHAFGATGRLTIRHGGISLWGKDGYYTDRLLGVQTPTLTPSHKNYEPSFGAELRVPLPSTSRQWLASVDVRDKLAYRFHQTSPEDEQRHWSWSVAVGRASQEGTTDFLRQVFFYGYHGVNPFGQLRSQESYWLLGVGWIFQ